MLEYIFSFIPLVGTSVGAFLGIANNFNNRFAKQESLLVAVATGILCSISLNLFFDAIENIRDITLYLGVLVGLLFICVSNTLAHKKNLNTKSKLFWAMIVHNMPEGLLMGISLVDKAVIPSTISLIISISLQNVPDGLVVSMPLVPVKGKKKALLLGILSGVVEPLVSILIIIAAGNMFDVQLLEPFLIGFSFSAITLIASELLKECQKEIRIAIITFVITWLLNSILN